VSPGYVSDVMKGRRQANEQLLKALEWVRIDTLEQEAGSAMGRQKQAATWVDHVGLEVAESFGGVARLTPTWRMAFRCIRCKETSMIQTPPDAPVGIEQIIRKGRAFTELHRDCVRVDVDQHERVTVVGTAAPAGEFTAPE